MKRTRIAIALLACLLLTTTVLAHEGHRHDAKGTIEAIDEEQISLMNVEGAKEVFMLTEETSFSRSEDATSREDVVVGERAVLMYEKKDGNNVAIEVKLGPKAE